MSLSYKIYNYVNNNQRECEVYAAPFAVFLNDDNYNYVEPDISVICDSSKLDDKGCHGAPDWIIELVGYTEGELVGEAGGIIEFAIDMGYSSENILPILQRKLNIDADKAEDYLKRFYEDTL